MMKKQICITIFYVLLIVSKAISAETQDQLKALMATDVFERSSALAAIENESEPSPEYIPALIDILTSKDIKPEIIAMGMRQKAALILAKIGAPAVPEVRRLMHDKDTRWEAVEILQRMGAPAIDALPELTDALQDKNKSIRYLAAKAIMQLGPKAKDAVPALIGCVNDKHDSAREFSIKALGEMGRFAESALPALKKAAKHKDDLTQIYAEEAIEKIEADLNNKNPNKSSEPT